MNVRVCVVILSAVACLAAPGNSRAQGVLSRGLWIDRAELLALPTSGTAWSNLLNKANQSCPIPNLANQDDAANVCVMAKALVFARVGDPLQRQKVVDAIKVIVNAGTYNGRALALGRELGAYVIAADLVDLKTFSSSLDTQFRQKIKALLTTPTIDGPRTLVECSELRPNNWGTHCGASRAVVAAYLGDTAQLARVAQVFQGYLGNRSSYAGFNYGTDLSWQCNPSAPVGINRAGCTIGSSVIDGVIPDDQRRAGSYSWPPPKENYVYEALQGALVQAVILKRAGYDPFNWENQALLRAFKWLYNQASYPAAGDDMWQVHLVNYYYFGAARFPVTTPTTPGKNVGWTDWTHAGAPVVLTAGGSYTATADTFVRAGTYAPSNYGTLQDLEMKHGNGSSQSYDRRAFLQFKLSGGVVVSNAQLKINVNALPNGAPVNVCVYGVASDAWTETGLTWNNQPSASGTIACKSITATGWAIWDVTPFVQQQAAGDRVVSLLVADVAQLNKMVRFDSREGASAPVLVVK